MLSSFLLPSPTHLVRSDVFSLWCDICCLAQQVVPRNGILGKTDKPTNYIMLISILHSNISYSQSFLSFEFCVVSVAPEEAQRVKSCAVF